MSKEEDSFSGLDVSIRNLGYYSGLTFGIGYILVFVGVIALSAEIILKTTPTGVTTTYMYIPPWFVAAIFSLFLCVVCGIGFGISVVSNSKRIRNYGPHINNISSSISAFSLMLLFAGITSTIVISTFYQATYPYYTYGPSLSLLAPISVIVGAILLLVGYRIYRGESLESKLTGGVLLIVSVIFIYFIAYASIQEYWNSLSGALVTIPYTPKVTLPPLPGPLVSEASIEAVTLLLLVICAVFYAFPYLRSGKGLSILKIVLSILVIIFACGLLRFNFSMVMMMSNLLPLLSQTLASVWMIFFGFLVLGISGIIMIISACLPIGLSIKELLVSKEIPAIPPTSTIQTKEETNIKYCHKCGTSMPLSATYCPKCGIKQPSKDK